jgi:hypothetical protein
MRADRQNAQQAATGARGPGADATETRRMKTARSWLPALVLVLATASVWAQGDANDRVIELRDGGRLVLRAGGAMGHFDAAGNPVDMKEGEVMFARDGTRITMKDDALWQQIIERGAYYYGLASTPPWSAGPSNARSIELRDGGRIVVQSDGTMVHLDAAGSPVRMKQGAAMVAKDGTRILMHDATLWSRIADGKASK